jgi:hypothetical protein
MSDKNRTGFRVKKGRHVITRKVVVLVVAQLVKKFAAFREEKVRYQEPR